MNIWAWTGSAAVIGILAACWRYVRVIWSQIASRVVVTVTVYDSPALGLVSYMISTMQQSRFGPRTYVGRKAYVRPRHRFEVVAGEFLGHGVLLFWRGWRPLWAARSSTTGGDSDGTAIIHRPLTLTFFRGTFDADKLVQEATEFYNDSNLTDRIARYRVYHLHGTAGKPMQLTESGSPAVARGRADQSNARDDFIGVRFLKWGLNDLGPLRHKTGSAIDDLAMNQEMRELWDRIQKWYRSREWFFDRGLPWKYGALLQGGPGTGKTMFVRSVAEQLDLPVFSLDLATFYNDELRDAWLNVQSSTPAIILIEDFDGVFNGRKPTNDKINLTFDSLLNCIDGVERMDGLLLFITTNKVETLDPALGGLTRDGVNAPRPGRIDMSVQFTPLDVPGKKQIASRILRDWPDQIENLVHGTGNDITGAQFERRCIDLAEKLYWENYDVNADNSGVRGSYQAAGGGMGE